MKRRILSLLVALCLIVGLLPAVAVPHAHAEETAQKEMIRVMGYTDMEAWTDGRSTYAINVPVDCTYTVTNEDGSTETVTFQGTQWKVIASATKQEPAEWNLKFEWPAGGTPTLILKGAILDYLDDETGKYRTNFTNDSYKYAIANKDEGSVLDLKIVIAEDSYIATPLNVMAECAGYADVIVESIGDAKLTSRSLGGIRSNKNLILNNANLDLEVPKYAAGYRPLYAPKGGITFNGGNYRLYSTTVGGSSNGQGAVGALIYAGAGDITFNGGTYDLHSGYYSTSGSVGAITNASANHTIIFNDGNMTLNHRNIAGFISKNVIQINGGSVNATGSYYTLYKDTGYVKMTGGSLELWRSGGASYYGASYIDVSEHPCWTGTWGSTQGATGSFTNLNATQRYINIVAHKQIAEVEAVAPDCVNDGTIAHYNCSKCGKNFADAKAKTELESVVDPSTGVHTAGEIKKENEVPADCTNGGTYEAVEYCTGCGIEMSRVTVDVAHLGHTEITVEQVNPTTTAVGYTAGTKCATCGIVLSGCEEIPKLKTAQIAIMSWSNMTVTEGGPAVYAKTVSYEGFTSEGEANGTGWKYTTTGASANDWNIKFEYPMGGTPTLTLKDAKLDNVGDNGSRLYVSDGAGGVKSQNTMSAVLPKSGYQIDLKIVLQGDNFIEADNGIVRGSTGSTVFFKSITIVGEPGSSLTGTGKAIGIQAMQGAPLTIENANINLTPVANGGGSAAPIYTDGGKLTIKNSTITGANTKNAVINTSGEIAIENSTLNVNSTFSSTSGAGAINADKTITITGSTINGESSNGAILTGAEGVTVNSGNLNLNSGNIAINSANGTITINGGEIEITASNSAFNGANLDLSGYEGWNAIAGTSKDTAKTVTEASALDAKYVKISAEPFETECDHTDTTTTEEVTKDATCTEAGSKTVTVTCEACGEVISETTETIDALGHTEEIIPGKDATCTETGLTEGKKCEICGEILVAQEEIAANGHTEAEAVVEKFKDSDLNNKGSYDSVIYCSVCKAELKRETIEIPVKEGAVAEANGVKYATLAEAVAAGGNVKLLTNVELDAPIVIEKGKEVILDLSTYKISYTSTVMDEAMITNKGTLTINGEDGSEIYYNYVGAADSSYGKGNYTISNGGTLTVNGGKINIANLKSHAKYPIDNNSSTGDAVLVINGGHLYNYNTSAIRQFCNSTTYKNTVTINGGLIEGYCAVWVQNPGSKTVNGKLTITGGEIRTTAAAYVNGTAALEEVGSAIYFTIDGNGGAWNENSALEITGGIFNENVDLDEEAPATIVVGEGATFNGRPPHTHKFEATYTEPTFEADGFWTYACSCGEVEKVVIDEGSKKIAVAEVDGTKFETLQAAIDAAGEGATVKLIANIEIDAYINLNKNVTLDLGEYNITRNTAGDTPAILVTNGANATITGAGTVTAVGPAVWAYGGNVTIESGNYVGGYHAVYASKTSAVVINGGKFSITETDDYGYVLNVLDADRATCSITVNGGEFVGFNPYNNGAEGTNTNFVVDGKHAADTDGDGIYTIDAHTEEAIPAVDATCTETGLTAGTKCSVCGEILVAQEEIPALGHTEETIPGYAADCKNAGLTDGVKCAVCGEILTAQEEIAALGHTEEDIPAVDATCTEAGLTAGVKCSVCGEILTAQKEIPATGHTYGDSHDTDCDVCGEGRNVPVVTVDGAKVNVDAVGNTLKQLHVFYVGDKTVEDIESWTALTGAAANIAGSPYGTGGYRSYTGETQINAITLPEAGNYVLRLEYVNAEGETLRMSDVFTVQASAKPGATVSGHKVTVNAGEGNTVTKVWAFYVGDVAVADINNWNQLVAAGQQNPEVYGTVGYKTYQGQYLDNIVLPANGNYVLRIQYTDGTTTKVMSQEVTISAAPAITVENGKVAVDGKGFELLTMSVFYLKDGSVENIGNWNALTAASANIAGSPYGAAGYKINNGETAINKIQLTAEGNYVLRLRYQDAEGEIYVLSVEATI